MTSPSRAERVDEDFGRRRSRSAEDSCGHVCCAEARFGLPENSVRPSEGQTRVSTEHAHHGRHEQADSPEGAQEDSQGNHPRGMQSPSGYAWGLSMDDNNHWPEEVDATVDEAMEDKWPRGPIISVP